MKTAGNAAAQQRLFDDGDAPWEADAALDHVVASVVIPNGPPRELDYLVPPELQAELTIGMRVKAPLGKGGRRVTGYCVALEARHAAVGRLKPLEAVVDSASLLGPAMVRLTRWMADFYLCDWGQVLEAVVPAGVKGQAGTRRVTLLSLAPDAAARQDLKLSPQQTTALHVLASVTAPLTVPELLRRAGCTVGPVNALRAKGLIVAQTRRLQTSDLAEAPVPQEENHILNADQQQALGAISAALEARHNRTILIRGVTGSGKTEVYIRAIQQVVSYGRQAIVLVPEISLTPQTKQRFRARFGNVAVLHSHLTDAQRHFEWQRIARGEANVVIGARSAVFAPTPNLGLIVLDEEHEGTFKQESAPRYHARDVALYRAKAENVPLVLGSATPSLESWHKAQQGEFQLATMPRRVMDRPMPDVATIDMRATDRARDAGAISRPLVSAMRQTLESGGQVILLLNRRGFATHLQCGACGEVVRCPNCDIALTHHRNDAQAICHYCGFTMAAPRACGACAFAVIRYGGLGTQKLEAEVRARFPEYPALRMDADSMQAKGSHEKALAEFRCGDVRILLGTQMIAKGLDFPNVTLVGVINADTALHLPDFRAAERTFQLLVQVAGRTGRGAKGGRVLVQTFSPEHAAIRAAVRHDYPAFGKAELAIRQELRYPPWTRMARLVFRGPLLPAVEQFADRAASEIRRTAEEAKLEARVLGPAPAPIGRLRNNFRVHLQIQAADGDALRDAIRTATAPLKPPEGVQWIVDLDPWDML